MPLRARPHETVTRAVGMEERQRPLEVRSQLIGVDQLLGQGVEVFDAGLEILLHRREHEANRLPPKIDARANARQKGRAVGAGDVAHPASHQPGDQGREIAWI